MPMDSQQHVIETHERVEATEALTLECQGCFTPLLVTGQTARSGDKCKCPRCGDINIIDGPYNRLRNSSEPIELEAIEVPFMC